MIAPTAMILGSVAPGATIGDRAIVGERSTIGRATLGDRVVIADGVRIEDAAVLGDWVTVDAGAVIEGGVRIGRRAVIGRSVHLKAGVVIGPEAYVDPGTVWKQSPLYIIGTKLPAFQPRPGFMQIACQSHEFSWWDTNGADFAKQAGFTPSQISEYLTYLELFKRLDASSE